MPRMRSRAIVFPNYMKLCPKAEALRARREEEGIKLLQPAHILVV